jgi:thiopeptide-type bacteriocin biosynthesis protein
MELSEEIFFHDSEATLRLLCLLGGDTSEKYRWLFAMCQIDALLDDFNFSLNAKQELLERLQQNYFTEFGAARASNTSSTTTTAGT